MPFQPYGTVVPVYAPEPEVTAHAVADCDFCGETIYLGERAVELNIGPVELGQKSGRPMVEPDEEEENYGVATVHEWCIAGYAQKFVCADQAGVEDDEAHICAFCESVIEED